MKVSAVIVNYNGEKFLAGCVASVFKQAKRPLEVTVIDPGSTDGSRALLKTLGESFKELQVVLLNENVGFAAAANIGIRRMQGEALLLLNSDTRLRPDFLEKLCAAAEKLDARFGMFSGKLLRQQDENLVDSAGQFIRRTLRPVERNYGKPDKNYPAGRIFSACGAVMLVKKGLLESLRFENEYFDEDLFMYFEDFDLGLRAARAGWKCFYEPAAVAAHYRGGSDRGQKDKIFLFRNKPLELKRHLLANRYLVLTKNASARLLLKYFPFLLVYEVFFWLYLLIFDIKVIYGLKKYFKLRKRMKLKGKMFKGQGEKELTGWIV